jgi:hypothetical protein
MLDAIASEAVLGAGVRLLESAMQQWRIGEGDMREAAQSWRIEWGQFERDLCQAAREARLEGGGAAFARAVEERMHGFLTGLDGTVGERLDDGLVSASGGASVVMAGGTGNAGRGDRTRQLQDMPPPGEEPELERFAALASHTLCAPLTQTTLQEQQELWKAGVGGGLESALVEMMGSAHAPESGEGGSTGAPYAYDGERLSGGSGVAHLPRDSGAPYAYDGAHLAGGNAPPYAGSKRCNSFLVVSLTRGGEFPDVLSLALRGCADDDGVVTTALQTATVHADWFVSGQAWHRFASQGGAGGDIAPWEAWGAGASPLHLFVAACAMRRPIIVYPSKRSPSSPSQSSQKAHPAGAGQDQRRSLSGIYLPLALSPSTCNPSPLLFVQSIAGGLCVAAPLRAAQGAHVHACVPSEIRSVPAPGSKTKIRS